MNYTIRLLIALFCVFLPQAKDYALGGENIWTTSGPEGGKVSAICMVPNNFNVKYIGTIENGVYKSTDGGNSWRVSNGINIIRNVRGIIVHPLGPDTLFVATAQGMFKSTDGGNAWRLLYPPWGEANDYRTIALNPENPHMIFAGGAFGELWKSTDCGESWYGVSISDPSIGVNSIAVDPIETNVMYLAGGPAYVGKGIYRSTDYGENWYNYYGNLDSSGFGVDIVIDPVNHDILYYSRYDIQVESGHCLSRSTDRGLTWTDITPPGLTVKYIRNILVTPYDHNKIYACADVDGLFYSSDGGLTWECRNNGRRVINAFSIEYDSLQGVLFLGTLFDGIYKSSDEGLNWINISNNINLQSCRDLAISRGPDSLVYAATMSGLFVNHLGTDEWDYIYSVSSNLCHLAAISVDYFDSGILYLLTSKYSIDLGNSSFLISNNGGTSWESRNQGLDTSEFFNQIAVSYSPGGARKLFLASGDIYYSDNQGVTWQKCINGLPEEGNFTILEVSPINNNILAAGDKINRVFISIDQGLSWEQTAEIPRNYEDFISDLQFDPVDANCVYAATRILGIMKSTNIGETWSNISNNLPISHFLYDYVMVYAITINPQNPNNIILLDTNYGIYQTHNGGQFWEPFNPGFDTTIYSCEITYAVSDTTTIYLASGSRSVWSIHRTLDGVDEDAPELPAALSLSSYPNPFNAQTTISYSLSESGPVTLTIYNLLGQKVATLFDGMQTAGEHSIVWDAADRPSGVYYCRMRTRDFAESEKLFLVK